MIRMCILIWPTKCVEMERSCLSHYYYYYCNTTTTVNTYGGQFLTPPPLLLHAICQYLLSGSGVGRRRSLAISSSSISPFHLFSSSSSFPSSFPSFSSSSSSFSSSPSFSSSSSSSSSSSFSSSPSSSSSSSSPPSFSSSSSSSSFSSSSPPSLSYSSSSSPSFSFSSSSSCFCSSSSYPKHVQASLAHLIAASQCLVPPERSLKDGTWVKIICGASFEDVADVRNLSLVYTLAGVDCIDCAADPSVVTAVKEGIDTAVKIARDLDSGFGPILRKPWIMISINDDEDIHFRKAEFDPRYCPPECLRPCENICPASAIQFQSGLPENSIPVQRNTKHQDLEGVITERCYGCGRCIAVCPFGLIGAKTYVRSHEAVAEILSSGDVDAIEIHTSARDLVVFNRFWENMKDSFQSLKLVAVSLPDTGDSMVTTMNGMYKTMSSSLQSLNLWQLDGRPMSGDIGAGATRKAVNLAARLVAASERPPGFLQLAGGTNAHTIHLMKKNGLSKQDKCLEGMTEASAAISGIAFGGYARKVVTKIFQKMDLKNSANLELYPDFLVEAVKEATLLVGPVKRF